MPVLSLEEALPPANSGQKLIGLDLGTKTIGIAASDIGLRLATPRAVVRRGKFAETAKALLQIAAEENAAAAIIGLPLNMDGSSGPRAQATRAFVRSFAAFSPLPFVFWDERLSTVAAERRMIANNVSRAKRKQRIDSAAAAFILQGALDRAAVLRANLRQTGL